MKFKLPLTPEEDLKSEIVHVLMHFNDYIKVDALVNASLEYHKKKIVELTKPSVN